MMPLAASACSTHSGMNDAQTFDHESPQGDMTFGSAIGLKFTLAFPGAFMKKILPAVLMLCALAAGSQPVCAVTDDQLMREEITAGMTDPAVIRRKTPTPSASAEKRPRPMPTSSATLQTSRLFLNHVVEQFKKAGIDGAKLRAVHDHGTSDELAALSRGNPSGKPSAHSAPDGRGCALFESEGDGGRDAHDEGPLRPSVGQGLPRPQSRGCAGPCLRRSGCGGQNAHGRHERRGRTEDVPS